MTLAWVERGRTQNFATLARREQTDNNAYMHGARRRAWRRAQSEPSATFIANADALTRPSNIWQRVTATRVLQPGKASVRDDGSDGRTLMRRAVRGTPEATETTEATVTTEALLRRRAVRGTLKRRKRRAGDVDATHAMLRRCDVQPTEAMRVYRLCAMRAERQKTSNDD